MKHKERCAFLCYHRDLEVATSCLDETQLGQLLLALYRFSLGQTEDEETLSPMLRPVYMFMRNRIAEDAKKYDLVPQITKDAPPVFLAATAEDLLTTYGALPVAKAYSDVGKPYELHVFQYGPHGYALANEVTADGSCQVMDPAFAQWQDLSVLWLHRTFGKPEFVDKSTSKMVGIMKEMGLLDGTFQGKGAEFA